MNNKKIIFKVTRTYMKKNKRRTAITFAGILVMVILMTAVFVGKDTVMEFMKRAVEADKGKWHILAYDVDKNQLDQISELKSVEEIGVSKPLGYTEFPQSGNPDYTPYLEIKGYSEELFDWMNINVIEGRVPEADDEILISERAIKEGSDIKVGDTIEVDAFDRYIYAYYMGDEEEKIANGEEIEVGAVTFFSGFVAPHGVKTKLPEHFGNVTTCPEFEIINEPTGFKKTVKVVGIMEAPFYEAEGQGGYISLMKIDANDYLGTDFADNINIVLMTDLSSRENSYDEVVRIIYADMTAEEKEELMSSGAAYVTADGERFPLEEGRLEENTMLMTFASKGTDANFNALMIFFQAFFIILITAAALILIYNVFSISFKERSKYLGMLSSVGATRTQKRWSVYYEVFTLLAVALPVGIVLGIAVVKLAMVLLYPHFASIISTIATNVITGKSCDIGYTLIVNPLNILFVIIFSVAAVWISAWIPAMKISKVGPVESIRGGEQVKKVRKSGFKTNFNLMKKGKAESLLASASVNRNRYSTKGIIRSITTFIALTLVTAFAVRSFTDILKTKANREDLIPGAKYEGFDYQFSIEDSYQYASGVQDIITSNETSDYMQIDYYLAKFNISMDDYSEEYKSSLTNVMKKFFPEEFPDYVYDYFLEPVDISSNPAVNVMSVSDEDFIELAKRAGVDTDSMSENTVLASDMLKVCTDDYLFEDGALKPDYTVYEVKNPFDVKKGETFNLLECEYNVETEEVNEIDVPVTFGGYLSSEEMKDYFELGGNRGWIIVSESTMEYLDSFVPFEMQTGIRCRAMLFNVNTEDSNLVRRLSQVKNEFGESAIMSASMFSGMTDFKNAIIDIVQIVAICFTILIGLICLLNLYNSVMGRRLSRHQELSVLASMGITKKQRSKMLLLENAKLLGKSFVYSGVITAIFVVCLRTVLSNRFGKMIFTLPVWMIALTVLISVVGLAFFTVICYSEKSESQLIDEVRTEMV